MTKTIGAAFFISIIFLTHVVTPKPTVDTPVTKVSDTKELNPPTIETRNYSKPKPLSWALWSFMPIQDDRLKFDLDAHAAYKAIHVAFFSCLINELTLKGSPFACKKHFEKILASRNNVALFEHAWKEFCNEFLKMSVFRRTPPFRLGVCMLPALGTYRYLAKPKPVNSDTLSK